MNCICGDNLRKHDSRLCAKTHRERVVNLRNLLLDISRDRHYDLSWNRPFGLEIYDLKLHTKPHDTYCILCANMITDTTYKLFEDKKIAGGYCFECYGIVCDNGGDICPVNIQPRFHCRDRKRDIMYAVSLCLLRLMPNKDMRKMILNRCRELCKC